VKIETALGLAVAVAASFSSRVEIVAAAAVLACLVALFADREALRRVLRLGLVIGAIFAASVAAAAVAWASGVDRGAVVGATVLLRIIVLAITAAVVARGIDAEMVLRAVSRVGLERLGSVFGLALNCLPHLGETAEKVWAAHRVRSRGRWAALARTPALAEVLLAHTSRVADRAAAAAALRGHAFRARPGLAAGAQGRTVVVTGEPGAGKTPVVERAAEALVRRGVRVAGFVQPAIVEGGAKVGFRIRDLATGESVELARRVETGRGAHGTSFVFCDEGFELGRRSAERAAAGGVLVVDELGPVELRGGGHWPAVERALTSVPVGGLVVVVRRSLVPALIEALDLADVVVVDLGDDPEDPDGDIVRALVTPV
jgi:nucleoside-triphosphatase